MKDLEKETAGAGRLRVVTLGEGEGPRETKPPRNDELCPLEPQPMPWDAEEAGASAWGRKLRAAAAFWESVGVLVLPARAWGRRILPDVPKDSRWEGKWKALVEHALQTRQFDEVPPIRDSHKCIQGIPGAQWVVVDIDNWQKAVSGAPEVMQDLRNGAAGIVRTRHGWHLWYRSTPRVEALVQRKGAVRLPLQDRGIEIFSGTTLVTLPPSMYTRDGSDGGGAAGYHVLAPPGSFGMPPWLEKLVVEKLEPPRRAAKPAYVDEEGLFGEDNEDGFATPAAAADAFIAAFGWEPAMRHRTALAVAGLLARWGYNREFAQQTVLEICLKMNDEEAPARARNVKDTYDKFARDPHSIAGVKLIEEVLAARGMTAGDYPKLFRELYLKAGRRATRAAALPYFPIHAKRGFYYSLDSIRKEILSVRARTKEEGDDVDLVEDTVFLATLDLDKPQIVNRCPFKDVVEYELNWVSSQPNLAAFATRGDREKILARLKAYGRVASSRFAEDVLTTILGRAAEKRAGDEDPVLRNERRPSVPGVYIPTWEEDREKQKRLMVTGVELPEPLPTEALSASYGRFRNALVKMPALDGPLGAYLHLFGGILDFYRDRPKDLLVEGGEDVAWVAPPDDDERLERMAVTLCWAAAAPFSYARRQFNRAHPWLYLTGGARTGKSCAGRVALAMWGRQEEKSGGQADTPYRLEHVLGTSTLPVLISEVKRLFDPQTDMVELIKAACASTRFRGGKLGDEYKDRDAFSGALLTGNYPLPQGDSALSRRVIELFFPQTARPDRSLAARYQDWERQHQGAAPALGRLVLGDIAAHPHRWYGKIVVGEGDVCDLSDRGKVRDDVLALGREVWREIMAMLGGSATVRDWAVFNGYDEFRKQLERSGSPLKDLTPLEYFIATAMGWGGSVLEDPRCAAAILKLLRWWDFSKKHVYANEEDTEDEAQGTAQGWVRAVLAHEANRLRIPMEITGDRAAVWEDVISQIARRGTVPWLRIFPNGDVLITRDIVSSRGSLPWPSNAPRSINALAETMPRESRFSVHKLSGNSIRGIRLPINLLVRWMMPEYFQRENEQDG